MINPYRIFISTVIFCFTVSHALAQVSSCQFQTQSSPELRTVVEFAVTATLEDFKAKGLRAENVAVTLVDLQNPSKLRSGEFRGDAAIYPASVVKVFYMAALHRWLEDGKLKLTPEITRGLSDMITASSNDATGFIVDVLTGTSSGAEIPEKEFRKWAFRRNSVNRYYDSLGYRGINLNQKTYCEDAYGIEQQFRNYKGENRNMLTTNATARLMTEIALGRSVSPARSGQMMKLMVREWEKAGADSGEKEFVSYALAPGTKLWSKEGWTSSTRHDAAYIETPDGRRIVLVIFTENFAAERDIIPGIAHRILEELN